MACPAVLLAILGVSTWRQSGMYRDSETLYRETLARNPTSWMAHNNLGIALWQMPEEASEAIAEYRAALRIKPDYLQAHNNLGHALAQIPGRVRKRLEEYRRYCASGPTTRRRTITWEARWRSAGPHAGSHRRVSGSVAD